MQTKGKYFVEEFSSTDSGGASLTWQKDFFFIDFHKDYIRSDLTDSVPWDDIFLIRPEQIAKLKRAGNDNGTDTPFAFIEDQVADTPQFFAVASVDHIFFF
jgi:hypothetical protein